jgi:hypothetical protein
MFWYPSGIDASWRAEAPKLLDLLGEDGYETHRAKSRARCFNSDERGPTAVVIVGKKALGSDDFRQSWRTRLLFTGTLSTKWPCTGRDYPPKDCGG